MASKKDKYFVGVSEANADYKFFTMIPNMVDDMDLSVAAFRLYVRIKRRASEHGKCFESVRSLAKSLHMNTHTVTDARNELETLGLIKVEWEREPTHGHYPGHVISVVNIWGQNANIYGE